jgi:hypothetical protein
MTVILATEEADIRRIVVQGQPTLQKRAGSGSRCMPEFKPQYCKKKKKKDFKIMLESSVDS